MDVNIHVLWIFGALVAVTYARRALPSSYVDNIKSNQGDVSKILQYLKHGDGKHMTYNRLAEFVDKFGNRFTGTETLEQSIDYMVQQLQSEGFDKVETEEVTVPVWVRGDSKVTLLEPRSVDMYAMGLMHSVGGNVEAEAIVVKTFDELYQRRNEAQGKIVIYNQEWTSYLDGYVYRTQGAAHAANVGATAALIRSVADFSIYSPHTGSQAHWSNLTAIPSACITIEDAEMLHRMHERGDTIKIRFEANHQTLADGISRNIIAEITGSEFPNEYVMFGGHIDSWDVGVGAMDDGGGILVARQVLSTIKKLGLRPRRTLRMVMWTAEEIGIIGGKDYFENHKDQLDRMSFVMESDSGTFSPLGLNVHNTSGLAKAIIEEILEMYLSDQGSNFVGEGGLGKADIGDWISHGVPGVALQTQNDKYFFFHHTEGDTMTVEDPDELDRCSALFTVAAYVVANLDEKLPRTGEYPYSDTPFPSSAAYRDGIHGIQIFFLLFLVVASFIF